MATYVFESMSASDAANFTSGDALIFLSAAVKNMSVTNTPSVTTPLQTTAESTTLSDNAGHTLTFNAAQLSAASNSGSFTFVNGDTLGIGAASADSVNLSTTGAAGFNSVQGKSAAAFGFDGDDTLVGSNANDTINGGNGNDTIIGKSDTTVSGNFAEQDYLYGGAGGDTITGGLGNDHIYGNTLSTAAGTVDGADSILAGNGKDYVNGNAGNDTIDGGFGDDRLYGGNGDDSILGSNGIDYLQGNKGNDFLSGGNGIDELHGGADNDSLSGGNENDALFGDNGNDTIAGDLGFDQLTGGNGADTFAFAFGDNDISNVGTTGASANVVDTILDFVSGTDKIDTTIATPVVVVTAGAGVTFAAGAVKAALDYAQQRLDNNTGGNDVAAITVGTDTYLFYDHNGANNGVIDSVVRVVGNVTFAAGDFI